MNLGKRTNFVTIFVFVFKKPVANIELLPICSSKFHFGAPSNTAQCINAWLNRILRSSPIGESKDSVI